MKSDFLTQFNSQTAAYLLGLCSGYFVLGIGLLVDSVWPFQYFWSAVPVSAILVMIWTMKFLGFKFCFSREHFKKNVPWLEQVFNWKIAFLFVFFGFTLSFVLSYCAHISFLQAFGFGAIFAPIGIYMAFLPVFIGLFTVEITKLSTLPISVPMNAIYNSLYYFFPAVFLPVPLSPPRQSSSAK